MYRFDGVDFENQKALLDPESNVYKDRREYLLKTCYFVFAAGIFYGLGFYTAYSTYTDECGDSSDMN